MEPDDDVTAKTNIDVFNARRCLPRPNTISENHLRNLSFYAFWRIFFYCNGKLHRRQVERFISLTGVGYQTHAARKHALHEEYAKKTLYAYMPCDELRGTDYVDAVCEHEFDNYWAAFLRAFVEAKTNKWCPTWISRNYAYVNKASDDTESESDEDDKLDEQKASGKDNDDTGVANRPASTRKPRNK